MPDKPRTCKGCHKPVYKRGDAWDHEQRVTAGAPPSGTQERRKLTPPAELEPAPRRWHFLNAPMPWNRKHEEPSA